MFKKTTGSAAPLGSSAKEAPKSFNSNKPKDDRESIIVGNLVAVKDGERIDVAVLFSKDGGRTISSAPGKRGTDFDGASFFINVGSKAEPKRIVIEPV